MSCEIKNKINSGSFGDVYKVVIKKDNDSKKCSESFALKVIQNNLYGIQCFVELMILLFCNHKYIINCIQYSIDIKENMTKILMPLATCDFNSGLLRKISFSKNLFDKSRLKAVLWQIVCAICFLHSKGIVHGDIKPSNILLCKNEVKLADFSLSSFVFNNDRIYNKEAYTEYYRPPEIWAKKGYSYKADVWALGCSFHEIIYGKRFSIDNPTKYLLEEKDIELKELLTNMLSIVEEKRFTIWDVFHSSFFSNERKHEKIENILSYPENKILTKDAFLNIFYSLLSKYLPDIPFYVYDILSCKFFRIPIQKEYKIYLNKDLIKYESQILETIYINNLGESILNF
jgi:serine/threonine protein kinase